MSAGNPRVQLDDRFKAVQHTVADLNISVPFISNFPYLVDTFVQPAFSATINGTRLAIQGHTKPFSDSLESSIEVNLVKVDLPYYLAYLPVKLKVKLQSAILDTRLKVPFIQYRDRAPRVDVAGGVVLSAVDVVDDANRPLVKWPSLDIAIDSSDLLSNRIALGHVWLRSLAVHVRRGQKGELQFQSLLVRDTPSAHIGRAPSPCARRSNPTLESGDVVARSARASANHPSPGPRRSRAQRIAVRGHAAEAGPEGLGDPRGGSRAWPSRPHHT